MSYNYKPCPQCKDKTGRCFARSDGVCMILLECEHKCKFKKPLAAWTNGIKYPYNPPVQGEQPNKFKKKERRGISLEQYMELQKGVL